MGKNNLFIGFIVLLVLLVLPMAYSDVTSANVFLNPQPTGEPCVSDEGCITGLCVPGYGICACLNNGHCPNGYVCINNLCVTSHLSTDFNKYSMNTNVTITGDDFSSNGLLELSIRNSSAFVFGPLNRSLDSGGWFTYSWNISDSPYGNYTVVATDLNESALSKNITFQVVPPYTLSVRVVDASNASMPSIVNISIKRAGQNDSEYHLDDENISTVLSYAVYYNIRIQPTDEIDVEEVFIDSLVNIGNLSGELVGIDDTPENASTFANFVALAAIQPYFNVSRIDHYSVVIKHPTNKTFVLFKCVDWNFTERRCNTDATNWTFVKFVTAGASLTTVDIYNQGDPGLGVFTSCGRDIDGNGNRCDSNEDSLSCPEDCPPGSPPPSGGGGGVYYRSYSPAVYKAINATPPEEIKKLLADGMKLLVPYMIKQYYIINDSASILLKDQFDEIIVGAHVKIIKPDGEVYNLKTGMDGTVMIVFDIPGLWKVQFSKEDYIATQIEINVGLKSEVIMPFFIEKVRISYPFFTIFVVLFGVLASLFVVHSSAHVVKYRRTVMHDILLLKEKEKQLMMEHSLKNKQYVQQKKKERLATLREKEKKEKAKVKVSAVEEKHVIDTDKKHVKEAPKKTFIEKIRERYVVRSRNMADAKAKMAKDRMLAKKIEEGQAEIKKAEVVKEDAKHEHLRNKLISRLKSFLGKKRKKV
ncbi:hypothetical protein DRJ17_00400 [Candidatus Woesearchaeota archaeon]|nr:MAG: hypothetical protein DRJ17_00400 [Candidatus Woesearchaeota archaeon]